MQCSTPCQTIPTPRSLAWPGEESRCRGESAGTGCRAGRAVKSCPFQLLGSPLPFRSVGNDCTVIAAPTRPLLRIISKVFSQSSLIRACDADNQSNPNDCSQIFTFKKVFQTVRAFNLVPGAAGTVLVLHCRDRSGAEGKKPNNTAALIMIIIN